MSDIIAEIGAGDYDDDLPHIIKACRDRGIVLGLVEELETTQAAHNVLYRPFVGTTDEKLATIEADIDETVKMTDVQDRNKSGVVIHNRIARLKEDFLRDGATQEQKDRLVASTRRLLTEVFNIEMIEDPGDTEGD